MLKVLKKSKLKDFFRGLFRNKKRERQFSEQSRKLIDEAVRKEKKFLADSLADIAHQLRTPLTSANLILALLEKTDDSPDNTDKQELIGELEMLLVRMDWLITALLKMARLESGVALFMNEKFVVKDLIQMSLRPLAIPIELAGVQVYVDVPEHIRLIGDKGWLSEAIVNILKNCVESVANSDKAREIVISCSANLLYTEIVIRDSGAGFSEANLPHIFERFYTSKTKANSYGIGLALAQMIVTQQGGSLTAQNAPASSGGGAIFFMRINKLK